MRPVIAGGVGSSVFIFTVGVNFSTVSLITWRFIEAMEERVSHHLRWPDSGEMEKIKSKVEKIHGMPN